jgi:hypothetical protein
MNESAKFTILAVTSRCALIEIPDEAFIKRVVFRLLFYLFPIFCQNCFQFVYNV